MKSKPNLKRIVLQINKPEKPYFLCIYFADVFFLEVGGFDIVMETLHIYNAKNGKEADRLLQEKITGVFYSGGDIYALFMKRRLFKSYGVLSYIASSNKWSWASYGMSLRNYLQITILKYLLDLGLGF
jgi:hypothetical protein